MTTLDVLTPDGTTSGTIDLPAEIFDVAVNVPLLHQVVVAQQAAARQGTASAKTRGEVSGGGAKPGGVVHGPVPRNYAQRTPKKMKAAALRCALSDRARDGRLHVLSTLVEGDVPSTKAVVAALRAITQARHVLVVVDRADALAWKSLRNVSAVHAIAPDQLNTYDVLVSDDIVFTQAALETFLAGPARGRSVKARATSGDVTPAAAPATDVGTTVAAGAGLSDEEMATEVTEQTSPDLAVQGFFERESDGVVSDTAAADVTADEAAGATDPATTTERTRTDEETA